MESGGGEREYVLTRIREYSGRAGGVLVWSRSPLMPLM